MSILNNLNKKRPNSKFASMLKVGAGIGVAGGLYGAGEFSKNTDRLHNDFGHVGSILNKIDENTSVASSFGPMPAIGGAFPILKDKRLLDFKDKLRIRRTGLYNIKTPI